MVLRGAAGELSGGWYGKKDRSRTVVLSVIWDCLLACRCGRWRGALKSALCSRKLVETYEGMKLMELFRWCGGG